MRHNIRMEQNIDEECSSVREENINQVNEKKLQGVVENEKQEI